MLSLNLPQNQIPHELIRQYNKFHIRFYNFIGDDLLRKIARKYEIGKDMVEHLRKLRDFEIAIVCDDSGSMITPVYGTQRTRWDELCDIVKIVVEIGVIFDSNGVDIHFLNGEIFHNVKDSQVVEQAFKTSPSGYTPLVPILSGIFESKLAARGRDKKLLVFVATDGAPTDDDGEPNVSELESLMLEKRNVETTYVSFLVCTDDPRNVEYLDQCYRTMKNVDVTDDFKIERERMYRCCKQKKESFSFGDYVVKALVGAIDGEIHAPNESN